MKYIPLFLFALIAHADDNKVPGWECAQWADNTFYLHCGGATVGHYNTALACVKAKKEICGVANSDYECRRWADNTFDLYCGGAYLAKYPNALACIKGKRATCD